MSPKSHTLFHFTKSLEVLKSLVLTGFWPRYCVEDTEWMGFDRMKNVAWPMVCFCDIPLSRIDEHVNFYGEYGIGMTKEWAVANGLNPVTYIAGDNTYKKVLNGILDHIPDLDTKEGEAALKDYLHLLAYVKPIEGTMVIDGVPIKKEFYQESEWRLVPRHENIKNGLMKAGYEDAEKLKEANEETRTHCLLKFTPGDVKYIFVKSDADIPQVMQFIDTNLDHYPARDVKVLQSRITSLESIKHDL